MSSATPIYHRITEQIFQHLKSNLTVSTPRNQDALSCYLRATSDWSLQGGIISLRDGPRNHRHDTFTLVTVQYDGTVFHYHAEGGKTYRPVHGTLTESDLAQVLKYIYHTVDFVSSSSGPLCGISFNCRN